MSRSALTAGLRHLRGVIAAQHHRDDSDEQLLHAFAACRDETAFAVLVRRHGPMVLHVCRRVLGHEQDAEDAFQATFLVLARKAATLRKKTAVASFLHGTAYRLALNAKRAAARRRKHEGSLGAQTQPRSPVDPADELSWREVRSVLDEEIAHLPEKYRGVFVLCCLEGLSRGEAARRLGLQERTVLSRLAEARKRLSRRLARRGVELTTVLAATALAAPSASALPAVLTAKTLNAALAAAAGEGMTGLVSAAAAELVEGATAAVTLSKAKMATVLLLSATLLAGAGAWTCRTLATPQPAPPPTKAPASSSRPAQQARKAKTPRQEKGESVTVTGRVLGPDGKPAAGAQVTVNPLAENEGPVPSTTTGQDGRFSLVVPRSNLMVPRTKVPLRTLTLVATAKGCGPDWRDVPLDDAGKEVTLRLVKDDVPIRGRILSLEGKPLAGIQVSVQIIEAFPKGDLSRALQAERNGTYMKDVTDVKDIWCTVPDLVRTIRTDAEGRFRLDGIGRDRIATLHLTGLRIHYSSIRVITRPSKAIRNAEGEEMFHGAVFDYLAKPSRLIRGTVREKGTGKPLAGIRVGSLQTTASAVTDHQGHYELPGCPKGDHYAVMAYPTDRLPYIIASRSLKDTVGLDALTADLELMRGIPFEGKVLDAMDKPVMGSVNYHPLNPNPNVTGNIGGGAVGAGSFSGAAVQADGSFRCVVLPGPGAVTFVATDADRYMSACVDTRTIGAKGGKDYLFALFGNGVRGHCPQEQFQAIFLINPDKETKKISKTERVKMAPGLRGTIRDSEGKPFSGVRVRGLTGRHDWTTLAADQFTVHSVNPRRPRRLYFIHEARHLIATVEVKGTETKSLSVRLQPWAAVRGRLLDADGRPLRNAKLRGSEFLPEDGRTDDEGRFRLEGLIPGLRYDLTYRKDKPFVSGMLRKGFVGKPGEVRDLGDVRGQPNREK